MIRFSGRLALQQRALPSYRAPFFDLLASACDGGMSLFTGLPRPVEGIATTDTLRVASYQLGKNIHLFHGKLYLCYQIGLLNWLKNWNPDALIVEANPRYLSTPAAVKWMHGRGCPVIGWGLGAPVLSGQLAGFRQRRWETFLKQFDALIAYSQRGADEYAALGFPCEKIFVAHNSVSRAPASASDRRPEMVDRFTILFVGRLQARKRVDSLLKACAQLGSNPRLIIVGEGPERERLQSLAKEIYPETEFVGAKHGAALTPYFTDADLFVLPGTGGLAIQEAMSHGLPVIVARGDGTQDDLVRNENGWQIPPDDFEALLSTMKDALSDVARLRRMGAESYRIVSEEINIEKMVETFITALNNAFGKIS
ncbi:MAG TPA: glycosyltransferase family 4 protein [Anaerolineales bacterium]|nr:glycosyltransferase family 4 protein [Anaerolineales bacterium]